MIGRFGNDHVAGRAGEGKNAFPARLGVAGGLNRVVK
jgi:hypothetical protein